ncbi:hypothetical protein Y032_0757g2093 [Ancylostoma ceylanicum]|uniref:Uncharacterized protein n=1 Tax=Ancylostoma ceylanicum TaxID=53326 RepID=A0A016WDJ0_9BILA|nr:hypothetical protein Y032_0757g2093 [Ancylostoma ceylanicum]
MAELWLLNSSSSKLYSPNSSLTESSKLQNPSMLAASVVAHVLGKLFHSKIVDKQCRYLDCSISICSIGTVIYSVNPIRGGASLMACASHGGL